MGFVKISDNIFPAIADAIRFKTGESGVITPREMPGEIMSISGGSDSTVPLYTKAEWDALTEAQKQSFGLVAISENESGYTRGVLVNGADYVDIGRYLPYSDFTKITCEAFTDNFVSGNPTWGLGTTPVTLGASCAYDSGTNSISVPVYTSRSSTEIRGTSTIEKTIYAVLKRTAGYNRLISCFMNASAGQGAMLAGSTGSIMFSRFADDTNFTNSPNVSTRFVAMAFKMCATETAGFLYGLNAIKKSASPISSKIALGSTSGYPNGNLEDPCDLLVKYVAVVSEYEEDSVISNNLTYLNSNFVNN